ncbi:MAG: precorrin-8X methylmutase [Deltaproteobacteria bacterium]|nr:precorrin-8X methylmutase [Deltaproteobacteria bacterium]MBW2137394.1 precorrin-8X methylmutase [Deltaproteobacteria bacterium]
MNNRTGPPGPSEIERLSLSIIDAEVPEPRPFEGDEWVIVRRMIHTSADFELLELVDFHPDAIEAGLGAITRGCLLATDTEMVKVGIGPRRLEKWRCTVECHIGDEEVVRRSRGEGITRASAAVDRVFNRINGGIYVIGNAPTALMRLLDLVESGLCRPALVVGMPVGFVNAAESKERLVEQGRVPYITIRGRKGGSALAATVINALAGLAKERIQKEIP